jgi:hypothetical protein
VQGLLNGLTGTKTSPPAASAAPMSSTSAANHCATHLSGRVDLFGTLHSECRPKLTGMTPTQANEAWASHRSNIAAWLAS